MSALARAVYAILRSRLCADDPRITYAELARAVGDAHAALDYLNHRSRELYTALDEVGRECRRLRLPPLPALVVRADTRRPGDAYHAARSAGKVLTRDQQVAAWQRDLERVKKANYPA